MIELKPCPFCGSKAKIVNVSNGTRVPYGFTKTISIMCSNSECLCTNRKNYNHEFYVDDDGSLKLIKDGYAKAAEDWNRRLTNE